MFRSFGWPEILLVLGVLLLLFGAKRLPQMGNSLGRGMREFKNGIMGQSSEEGSKKDESESPSEQGSTFQP